MSSTMLEDKSTKVLSKLDNLFCLLDTGSNSSIRKAAADQIGEIQKYHPSELNSLLPRVKKYLHSNTWETRIAAAHALHAIIINVPHTELFDSSGATPNLSLFSLETFDICQILNHGIPLLGSAGNEYAYESSNTCTQEVVTGTTELNKIQLEKRLGLVASGKVFSTGLEGLFDADDFTIHEDQTQESASTEDPAVPIHSDSEPMVLDTPSTSSLSVREKAQLKRKSRLLARQHNKRSPTNNISQESECLSKLKTDKNESVAKRVKLEPSNNTNEPDDVIQTDITQNTSISPTPQLEARNTNEWPFIQFCEGSCLDLFSPQWEIRHGSALGLREIIKVHKSDSVNSCPQWLEDAAIHFICVLTLDRFADYVSDEVVAPVRETCAQALGLLSLHHSNEQLSQIVSILIQLISQDKWEIQHGGLLGLKYILATRPDLASLLLSKSLPHVLSHLLNDSADDVRASAAAALKLGVEYILTLEGAELSPVLKALNHCLEDLDDLSVSTTNVLDILSVLFLKRQDCIQLLEAMIQVDIWELIQKVMRFTPHILHSVRKCSVLTLKSLIQIALSQHYALNIELLTRLVNLCFEHAVLDPMEQFHQLFADLWETCLSMLDADFANQLYQKLYLNWVKLLVIPAQNPVTLEYLSSEFSLSNDTYSTLRGDLIYLGGASLIELASEQEEKAMRARELGSKCLSYFFTKLSGEFQRKLFGTLIQMASSIVAQEILCSILIYSILPNKNILDNCVTENEELIQILTSKLEGETMYSELYPVLDKLIQQQKICFTNLSSCDLLKNSDLFLDNFTIDTAFKLLNHYNTLKQGLDQEVRDKLALPFQDLEDAANTFKQEYETLQTRVCGQIVSVLILISDLPVRLNPFIRPLMDCIKREPLTFFQSKAAISLAILLRKCSTRTPSPNSKIVKNLSMWVTIACKEKPFIIPVFPENLDWNWKDSIFLNHQLFQEEKEVKRGRGHPKTVNLAALTQIHEKTPQFIQQRGAEYSLKEIVTQHGIELRQIVPDLCNFIFNTPLEFKLREFATQEQARECEKEIQLVVNAFITLTIIAEDLNQELIQELDFLVIVQCLKSNITTLRHITSKALVAVINTSLHTYMPQVCDSILPLLSDMTSLPSRQGATEFMSILIISQKLNLLPYISIIFLPILALIIDQNEEIRRIASHSLSHIIEYIPLEPTDHQVKLVSKELTETCLQYKQFTNQLLDPSQIEDVELNECVDAELRPYQQEGVNWLAFLYRYKLNGILCDDMGLGKTVQTLSILSYVNQKRLNENIYLLPSLVICPPTIAGHWEMEVKKFCHQPFLTSLVYLGMPHTRLRIRNDLTQFKGLVISSYDIVRNDIDFLKTIYWDYIVLDEGHIIKNTKTKISKAVKELIGHHKLILSGTPLQNSVLELWSLFDFLMPSYLGSERNFNDSFSKPISNSRESKSSSKEQEAGMIALESLHSKVLPFILRRTKDEVLKELPPKIIQDIYCKLSPLQELIYEAFSHTTGNEQIRALVDDTQPAENIEKQFNHSKKSHIFQALHYLRKICNHPTLVLDNSNYQINIDIDKWLNEQNTTLDDITHSCKLVTVKQLLIDSCNSIHSHNTETFIPSLSQHRVLIFCQLKQMLDLIQNMISKDLPQLSFLRLDGSINVANRMDIVNRFNSDPSIDILLLTTHVGGLGLTLTGADVVIFVDHDWNPMKDLQAMDRAHRIGQKKVVNVYRLIAQGTLEESIMGLQRFKMKIANTVITEDNLNLNKMSNQNMLGLFNSNKDSNKQISTMTGKGSKSMLDNLQELWDESEYREEYDIANFISSLPSNSND
ncbi:TATA-binding protein-associated factor [Oopsacas minuta]|uniref:TATA-binding protein-associated factor n=1 Tax=Oopsacas minuta TaxID=111878 RepID=A0AAV7JU56_9METZ|nr:TATA-binding protein-associated factor [Oopsacas minuta]